jgi:hypothetical protein
MTRTFNPSISAIYTQVKVVSMGLRPSRPLYRKMVLSLAKETTTAGVTPDSRAPIPPAQSFHRSHPSTVDAHLQRNICNRL